METLRLEVKRIIGGGESCLAAIESLDTLITRHDKSYNVEFVDLVPFNSQGKIVQLKEFYDSGHIQRPLEEHEVENKQAWQAK
ncbi:MAG: hypothetical protein Q9175_003592 [Cornicularia normoerica]